MGEYIELECSDCGTPPTLERDGQVGLVCDCSETIPTTQLQDQSVIHPQTGLWSTQDDNRFECSNCESAPTLRRLPADGYYVTCECDQRSIGLPAIGDVPLLDPFNGSWADIDI